jgi:uncharacterized protein YjiS (DUF1127 family)
MTGFTATCPEDSRAHRPIVATLGALLVRALLWPSRVMAARRTLSQLAAFSDHELRDIGLSRQDIADLTTRPLDEDPTAHLVESREARARNRAHLGAH